MSSFLNTFNIKIDKTYTVTAVINAIIVAKIGPVILILLPKAEIFQTTAGNTADNPANAP